MVLHPHKICLHTSITKQENPGILPPSLGGDAKILCGIGKWPNLCCCVIICISFWRKFENSIFEDDMHDLLRYKFASQKRSNKFLSSCDRFRIEYNISSPIPKLKHKFIIFRFLPSYQINHLGLGDKFSRWMEKGIDDQANAPG